MTGYRITIALWNNRRVNAFTGGYFKTKEDAEKYCDWLGCGCEPKIITVEKEKIVSWYEFDENSMAGLRIAK